MMTIALALALLGGDSSDSARDRCRKFGTALEWEESVEAARLRAEKEGKLVLVLHVSGRFEDPAFT